MLTIDVTQTSPARLLRRPRYKVTLTGARSASITLLDLTATEAFHAVARIAEKAIIEDIDYRITGADVLR